MSEDSEDSSHLVLPASEAAGRFTVTPAGQRKRLRRTSSTSTTSNCDSLDNELVVAAELHDEM